MLLSNFVYILFSFVIIWLGTGLVISQVEVLAKRIHISRFIVSFFLLGFATSVSEFSVAVNSLVYERPQISIGNLIGGAVFLLLFVIPLIALLGGGLPLKEKLSGKALTMFIVTVVSPLVVCLDGVVTTIDGVMLFFVYVIYILSKSTKMLASTVLSQKQEAHVRNFAAVGKIAIGMAIVFLGSNIAVGQVIKISTDLNVSAFFLSIVLVSLGTNIPEVSIAARSIFAGKKDIALGDYIGSATVNTLIMAALILFHGEAIILSNVAIWILVIFIIGISIFYFVCLSNTKISRKEAVVLIILYLSFLIIEGARQYFLL